MADVTPASVDPTVDAAPAAAPDTAAPEAAAPAPATINIMNPAGKLVSIPAEDHLEALRQGYRPTTPADIDQYVKEQAYGGAGQQAIAGLEGAAQGAVPLVSNAVETGLGLTTPEDIAGRAEQHPWTHGIGQGAGLVASSMMGVGLGGALEKAGAAASSAAGLGELTLGAKVGSAAIKGAVENALFQSNDEVERYFSNQADPNHPVQASVVDTLGAGLIGGALGASTAGAGALWGATVGPKVSSFLGTLRDGLGGTEAEAPMVGGAAEKLGVKVAPEVAAMSSSNPETRRMAFELAQSPSGSGGKMAKSLQEARNAYADSMAETMGVKPSELSAEWSQAETGNKFADAGAADNDRNAGNIAKGFEDRKASFGKAELPGSIEGKAPEMADQHAALSKELAMHQEALEAAVNTGNPEVAIKAGANIEDVKGRLQQLNYQASQPGAAESLAHMIGSKAMSEGWMADPDIAPHVEGVLKRAGQMKTVGDLQKEMSRLGDKAYDLMAPGSDKMSIGRAYKDMQQIMRGQEENIIGNSIGSEEGPKAYAEYVKGRADYHNLANIQDELNTHLHLKSSVSGFSKALKDMADEKSELIYSRLTGKNKSSLIPTLEKYYPELSQAVKESYQKRVLAEAVSKASKTTGERLDPDHIIKKISDLTTGHPELRDFAFPKAMQDRLGIAAKALEDLKDPNYGHSNSGRYMQKALTDVAGSAAGMAAAVTGHGVISSSIIGHLTKVLSKDAPDAVRLAMLKFLGSDKPVNAGAFAATVNFMDSTMKGENAIKGAVGSLFKAGSKVIPSSLIASSRDNDRLEKHLETIQNNPAQMMNNAGNGITDYMPGHAEAQSQTAANVATYLQANKPKPMQSSPLDPKRPPSPIEEAKWQNLLTIANQPLTLVQKIKDGTLTSEDMKHGAAMYPAFMQNIQHKITQEIADAQTKGTTIPYKIKQGMSLFMAQPLDSTMSPTSIMAAQSVGQAAQQQAQGGQPQGKTKKSTSSLGKVNTLYKTPLQASETQDTDRA